MSATAPASCDDDNDDADDNDGDERDDTVSVTNTI